MSTTTETPESGVYSTKEFNPETGTRVFNVEELKTAMGTLQGHFDAFANELKAANDLVTSDVNASCDHCVFGDHGMFMLNLWKENAATFHDFNANFEKWSQAIAVISNKNADFTNYAIDTYNNRKYSDNALTVSATYNGKDYDSAADMRADIIDDNAIVTTDANGNTVTAYFDENGNYIVKVTDSGGNLVSLEKSYYEDIDGDGSPDKLVVEKYDADGTTITEKTTTEFDEMGRVVKVETSTIIAGVSVPVSVLTNQYDDAGRLISTTTVDATTGSVKTSNNKYDENGNLVSTVVTENGKITYSQETKYNEDGLVESVTTVENGTTTTVTNSYDEGGNVTEVKTVTDDGQGNVTSTTDTYDRTTTTTTDADGNTVTTTTTTVKRVDDATGQEIGSTITETVVSGNTTTTTVTTTDNATGATSTRATTTTVTDDGSSQKITTTENGETTSVETKRDKDGDVTEVVSTDKDGNTATVTHNADGTTSVTYRDPNGQEIPEDQKPGSFNEDGSLKDGSGQQGTQPGTQPETQPGGQPGTQPETQPGGQPGTQPETQPGGQPGTQPETQPSTQPETQPSTQPETQPSTQPETQPSTQPETQDQGAAMAYSNLKQGDVITISSNGLDSQYKYEGMIQRGDMTHEQLFSNSDGELFYYENGVMKEVRSNTTVQATTADLNNRELYFQNVNGNYDTLAANNSYSSTIDVDGSVQADSGYTVASRDYTDFDPSENYEGKGTTLYVPSSSPRDSGNAWYSEDAKELMTTSVIDVRDNLSQEAVEMQTYLDNNRGSLSSEQITALETQISNRQTIATQMGTDVQHGWNVTDGVIGDYDSTRWSLGYEQVINGSPDFGYTSAVERIESYAGGFTNEDGKVIPGLNTLQSLDSIVNND